MGFAIDITGRKYGRLTAIRFLRCQRTVWPGHKKLKYVHYWLFACDCGEKTEAAKIDVTTGNTRSCGCLQKEVRVSANTTHGRTSTREFNIWLGMLDRCRNKNNRLYRHYGGRGIKVCQRWEKFENFYEDMGPRPTKKHSLDRYPDNNGDYKPSNCRWATQRQQCSNTRFNHVVEYAGKKYALKALCELKGIPYKLVHQRVKYLGWDLERALSNHRVSTKESAKQRSQLVSFRGEKLPLAAWCKKLGLNVSTVRKRVKRSGWSVEEALSTAAHEKMGPAK